MTDDSNVDPGLRQLLRDSPWPYGLTVGFWMVALLVGALVHPVPVLNPWPWLGLSASLVLAPLATLCWRMLSGASAKPWPRWIFWLATASVWAMGTLFAASACLSWRQGLDLQTLRFSLMALAMLSLLFIVRQLARLHASD